MKIYSYDRIATEVKMKNSVKNLMIVNTILLGLLMLVPGIMKLFVMSPSAVTQMLSGMWLFSWAPMFWAWILIIAEIGSGIAILANWKLKYIAIIPAIILAVALLFVAVNWSMIGKTNIGNVLFHLIAITNYLILSCGAKR